MQKKLNVFHHLFADIKKNTRSKERDNELFQNIFSTENPIKFKGKEGLIKKKKKKKNRHEI